MLQLRRLDFLSFEVYHERPSSSFGLQDKILGRYLSEIVSL